MSSLGEDFIIKIIPILFGAVLFLLLTHFNPITKKYVLTHDSLRLPLSDAKVERPGPALSYEEYLSDQLVINGLGIHKNATLHRIAFEKLSSVQIGKLPLILRSPTTRPSLSLISTGNDLSLLAHSSGSLSPAFGYLLPYLLDGSLKLVIL